MEQHESGIASQEEYRRASATMLMSTRDGLQSGESLVADGSGSYTWSLSWDTITGFTGLGWTARNWDYSHETEDTIRSEAFEIAVDLNGDRRYQTAGCVHVIRNTN